MAFGLSDKYSRFDNLCVGDGQNPLLCLIEKNRNKHEYNPIILLCSVI